MSFSPPPFDPGESLCFSARDGLAIHVRAFGPTNGTLAPIVCLPGLSRNSRDFLGLAHHFANHAKRPRRVYAFDFRGRGLSGHDKDWRNYNVLTEADDVVAGLAALNIERAVFVGTSRGGLVTMLLTAMRPGAIGAAVLNDIGPAIEGDGLTQIRLYLKQLPQPRDWADAIAIQKAVMEKNFTVLDDDHWAFEAHGRYRQIDGLIRPDHDPALIRTLTDIDLGERLPTMWPQFAGLKGVPVLVLRGENSSLLAEETVETMQSMHASLTAATVSGQGHAPMLHTPGALAPIDAFFGTLNF
ncbi:MAG: alpha/beta hydrolase [Roseitalea sp.]|nr:alpha/beta hydrolase [Roseitalea sp.]MBO6723972.1 alpha/beta hydrolase [Roseitalea sp.]MBO6744144.1 alpha/beta hydrolase [Roseitalea sp.]